MVHYLLTIVSVIGIALLLAACQSDTPPPVEPPATPTVPQPPTQLPATPMPTATPPPTQPIAISTAAPSPVPSSGANADVLHVKAVQATDGTWTFHVTVRHPDTGWEDYADGWNVMAPDGTILKPNANSPFTRLLLHPHESEQPFTRSQGGIVIPPEVTKVRVQAHDLVNGFGGREVLVDLEMESGSDFEVSRSANEP